MRRAAWQVLTLLSLLSCSGGGGVGVCADNCTPPTTVADFLTVADVERVIAQATTRNPWAMNDATALPTCRVACRISCRDTRAA